MKAILRSINIFSCKLKQSNNLKYNISPKIRSNKFKSISGSGNVVIEDALNKNLNDYKIHGNTVQKILPDGYTQVDYIESDGNQYINTGVNADSNLSVKMNFSSNYHIQQRHMGAIKNDNGVYTRHHITINGSSAVNYLISYSGQTNSAQNLLSTIDDNKHYLNLDIYNKKISVDEQTPIDLTLQPFDTGLNYWLFARNSNNSTNISFAIMRIYDCKMFYKGVLVRDFIPCYRNSDNEVGLYDLVNNLFYTNQRTEVFTYGSVAPTPNTPIDMVSCGDRTKNLFDTSKVYERINDRGINISVENKNVKVIGTNSTNNAIGVALNDVNDYYSLKAGKTYVAKYITGQTASANTYRMDIREYNNTGNILAFERETDGLIYTPTEDINIRFAIRIPANGTVDLSGKIIFEESDVLHDYEPYGKYKIPVNVRSDNLFDITKPYVSENLSTAGVTLTLNDDGTITVNGTNNASYKYIRFDVELEAGVYYFSGCPSGGERNGYSMIIQTGSAISTQAFDTGEGATFTLTEKKTIQFFPVRVGLNTVTFNNMVFKPMIAKIPVSYDDYQTYYNETTNIYLDEPLRKTKDGTYVDYIDFKNQKVYRQLGEIQTTNYAQFNHNGNTERYTKFTSIVINNLKSNIPETAISNRLFFCNYTSTLDGTTPSSRIRFKILHELLGTTTSSTAQEAKQALINLMSGKTMEFVYPLETPTEEDIELPNINLIEGKNIITIGTELESIIEVEYYSKEIIDISDYKYNLRKVED